MGVSQDSDGWTVVTPSTDTVIYFVSSTDGSGVYDGFDPQGFNISSGTYDHTGGAAEQLLTSTGTFSGYSLTANSEWTDYIYFNGATGGAATGLYEITSRVSDDSVTIAETVMTSGGLTSDATDITSSDGPKSAMETTFELLRDGYPDWMLLKRGDVWSERIGNTSNGRFNVGGRSDTERMLIGAYGNPATDRPKTTYTDKDYIVWLTQGCRHIVIQSISLSQDTKNPNDASYEWGKPIVGVTIRGVTSQTEQQINILLEDLYVRWASSSYGGGNVSSTTPYAENVVVRRCLWLENYTWGAHRQGMFVADHNDCLVEECVFYHCGWFGDDRKWSDGIQVSFLNADYTHSTRTLVSSGDFAGYTWQDGDKIWLGNSASGVVGGRYEIESGVDDDSIILASCNGLIADSSGDVDTVPPVSTTFSHGVYETSYLPASPNLIAEANVVSVLDNGAGKLQITIDSGQSYQVGDEIGMHGFEGDEDTGDGSYVGHFTITDVISATGYDLDHDWVVDSIGSGIIGSEPVANNLNQYIYNKCLFSNTSGAGLQLRSGGTLSNCVFLDQSYPISVTAGFDGPGNTQVFGVDGKIYNNYFEGMIDMTETAGGQQCIRLRDVRSCLIDSNVCISPGFDFGTDIAGISCQGGDRPENSCRGIVITNNRFWNHGKGAINFSNQETLDIYTIDTEENNYYDDAENCGNGDETGWPIVGTNRDINELALFDTSRDMAAYSTSIGGAGTKLDFINGMIANRRGSWNSDYTALPAITWISAGFEQNRRPVRVRVKTRYE